MTEQTQQLIARLKADRLAELQAERDAAEAEAAAIQHRADVEFITAAERTLASVGASWLVTFRVALSEEWMCDGERMRYVEFRVPEHRAIRMNLQRREGAWMAPHEDCYTLWTAIGTTGGVYTNNLADALIAADERDNPGPIPF
jgi:hypothetical protein